MHRLVDTKASKLDHLRKATHHGTDIIPIPTDVNIHRDFAKFTAISVYSTEWHYSLNIHCEKDATCCLRLEGHSSSGCSTPARYSDMHC